MPETERAAWAGGEGHLTASGQTQDTASGRAGGEGHLTASGQNKVPVRALHEDKADRSLGGVKIC